ncbi:flagellar hook-length control protein FliK [Marivita sp.]|uniref:flagellar hook-length control protein FliK n=1 Tax=Marivita sp. TaxID=2003365 RepID=UPI003A89820D
MIVPNSHGLTLNDRYGASPSLELTNSERTKADAFQFEMISLDLLLWKKQNFGSGGDNPRLSAETSHKNYIFPNIHCQTSCSDSDHGAEGTIEPVMDGDRTIPTDPKFSEHSKHPKLPEDQLLFSSDSNGAVSSSDLINLTKDLDIIVPSDDENPRMSDLDVSDKILENEAFSAPWLVRANVSSQPLKPQDYFLQYQHSQVDGDAPSLGLFRLITGKSNLEKVVHIKGHETPDPKKFGLEAIRLHQTAQTGEDIDIRPVRSPAGLTRVPTSAHSHPEIQTKEFPTNGSVENQRPAQLQQDTNGVRPSWDPKKPAVPTFEASIHLASPELDAEVPPTHAPRLSESGLRLVAHDRLVANPAPLQPRVPDGDGAEPQSLVTVETIGDILDVTFTSSSKEVLDLMSRNQHELKTTFKRLGIEGYEFTFNSGRSGSDAQKRSPEIRPPETEIDLSMTATIQKVDAVVSGIDKRV